MSKGGATDWPTVDDAGKRAIAQASDGEMVEGHIRAAGVMPGEDEEIQLFSLKTRAGEFIDWAELQGWKLF